MARQTLRDRLQHADLISRARAAAGKNQTDTFTHLPVTRARPHRIQRVFSVSSGKAFNISDNASAASTASLARLSLRSWTPALQPPPPA